VLLITLVVICLAQVIARYVFNDSFSWAEEISVVILLWATWGGACMAMKSNTHLRMSILEDRWSLRSRMFIRSILHLIVICFLVTVAVNSRLTIDSMANITLGSLPQIPMNIMYYSVPVGCLLLIYYTVRCISQEIQIYRHRR
jgi:C4-dicarboxylate transporter, DctQ subunit